MIPRFILFFSLFLSTFLYSGEKEQTQIRNGFILESTPDWFSTDLLDQNLIVEQLRAIPSSIGSTPYKIAIERHKKTGLAKQIILFELTTGEKRGTITLEWSRHEPKLLLFSIQDTRNHSVTSHQFAYDKEGRIIQHTLKGSLRGEKGEDTDAFTTKIEYQKDGYTFRYPNGSSTGISIVENDRDTVTTCIIQTKEGLVRRKISTESNLNSYTKEQEDDALEDQSPFSFRKWKTKFVAKSAIAAREEIVEEGVFDSSTKEKLLQRRTITRYGADSKIIESMVYDANNVLKLHSSRKSPPLENRPSLNPHEKIFTTSISGIGRVESITGISEKFQKILSYDLFGNLSTQNTVSGTDEEREVHGRIRTRYTSRREIAAKEYEDGTQEIFRYHLDGSLASHMLRDGTIIKYERDGLGRIKKSSRKKSGSTHLETCIYTYSGENVSLIEDSFFGKIELQRDLFGRIVSQTSYRGLTQQTETCRISYDALDRVLEVEAIGLNPFYSIQSYTLSGKCSMQKYRDENGKEISVEYRYSPEDLLLSTRTEESVKKTGTTIFFDSEGRESTQHIEALDGRFKPYVETITYENRDQYLIKKSISELGFRKEERYHLGSGKKEFYLLEKIKPTLALQDELMSYSQQWDWKDIYGSCTLQEISLLRSGRQIEKKFYWNFNDQRRVSEVFSSDGLHEKYSYDTHGRLISLTKSDGVTIEYKRNEVGQVIKLCTSDQSIEYQYQYNAQGLIIEAYDVIAKTKVVRRFSPQGELLEDGEPGKSISVLYDEKMGYSPHLSRSVDQIQLPDGASIHYLRKDNGSIEIEKRPGLNLSMPAWQMSIQPLKKDVPPILQGLEDSGLIFHKQRKCDTQKPSIVSTDVFGSISHESVEGTFGYTLSFLPTGDIIDYVDNNTASNHEIIELDSTGRTIRRGHHQFSYTPAGDLARYINSGIDSCDIEYSYDALQRLSSATDHINRSQEKYRYDAFHRIQNIECISLDEETTPHWVKKRIWFAFKEIGVVLEAKNQKNTNFLKIPYFDSQSVETALIESNGVPYRVIEDEAHSIIGLVDSGGNIVERRENDLFGRQVNGPDESASPWFFCGKQKLAFSSLYDFGLRRYMPELFHWVEKDPMGISDGIHYRSFLLNCPLGASDPNGLFSISAWIDDKALRVRDGLAYISKQIKRSVVIAAERLDQFSEFQSLFEDMVLKTINEPWMTMLGYNPSESHSGYVGDLSKNLPNIRITHINGVLNASKDQVDNAALVSLLHCNYPVYYVYSATNGFTGDIVRCAVGKAGVVSKQAKILADLWKTLIAEMGENDQKMIIHYAHSLGGTDTAAALNFLTPHEQSYIRIITFGSATLLGNKNTYRIDNYVSLKDGIPMFGAPGSYIGGLLGKREDIHFLESDGYPLVDHLFTSSTYRAVLEDLGLKFQEEFLKSQAL
ncbi:MAG: RHS repeat-associated core domain-containing protein [Chlamydia sp.]